MAIFSKFFGGFMIHIIRLNAGKGIKYFFELFINKVFENAFVSIFAHKTIHPKKKSCNKWQK